MRRVRPELQSQHARILKQDANLLFDQEAVRGKAQAGDFALDNTSGLSHDRFQVEFRLERKRRAPRIWSVPLRP